MSPVHHDVVVIGGGQAGLAARSPGPAPVLDASGAPIHARGVTPSPGLHFLGLPWQHTRGSALLGGQGRRPAHRRADRGLRRPRGIDAGGDGMSEPALIVVDVQRAFDDPSWGSRDNPDCEGNTAALIEHWRSAGRPLVFVRHDSDEPGSTLAPGTPGNAFKDVITGEPDLLVTKSVNSSFHGEPDLKGWLDGEGIRTIYVCGITTNHCCETTARVGGNLGYDVRFVLDATHAFDRADPFGGLVTAYELARVTATNLHGEFATVVDTATAIGGDPSS